MSTGSSYKKYKHKKLDLSHFMLDSVYKPIVPDIFLLCHSRVGGNPVKYSFF
ncbi:MAG: palindromic element RPE4 domain-containing protein [Rickettsia conorii subsp. raoultii]